MLHFVPNPVGLVAIARSIEMQTAMGVAANEIATGARAIAPYDPLTPINYRDEIDVAIGINEDGLAAGRVNAWVEWAGYVEFGTVDTPIFAPLRRASEAASL